MIDPSTEKCVIQCAAVSEISVNAPKACKNIMYLPDATDEPQQQEKPEPWSQASQASKQPVDSQRHNQDLAAPPLVSQVSPHVAAHHHS